MRSDRLKVWIFRLALCVFIKPENLSVPWADRIRQEKLKEIWNRSSDPGRQEKKLLDLGVLAKLMRAKERESYGEVWTAGSTIPGGILDSAANILADLRCPCLLPCPCRSLFLGKNQKSPDWIGVYTYT